jgi:hypothetical protein
MNFKTLRAMDGRELFPLLHDSTTSTLDSMRMIAISRRPRLVENIDHLMGAEGLAKVIIISEVASRDGVGLYHREAVVMAVERSEAKTRSDITRLRP